MEQQAVPVSALPWMHCVAAQGPVACGPWDPGDSVPGRGFPAPLGPLCRLLSHGTLPRPQGEEQSGAGDVPPAFPCAPALHSLPCLELRPCPSLSVPDSSMHGSRSSPLKKGILLSFTTGQGVGVSRSAATDWDWGVGEAQPPYRGHHL